MDSIERQLALIALEIKAIKLQPKEPFTWASGYQMPIYNDNRMLLGSAAHRQLVAEGFSQIIAEKGIELDLVAGTATAGIPHSTTLADKLEKPLIYIRSKAKGHGLQNQIEGKLEKGQKALVVEDLISTGGSSVSAVEAVRAAGGIVDYCFSIFSYGLEKAETLFSEANCSTVSLLTFPTLLEVAIETGYISKDEENLLAEWQKDPFGWGEKNGFPPAK